ncbi:leucine-rich repeat isoform f [Anaeramoeba flamelloides]|uniref:Leucine-rich repeat isoform f n=1 Tax=Anaeramoeba flamelloides TaxID=1746091 RepID=A0AAV8A948_9EUKA|nr:leucine-rich repeat isoform f [Anaeramoeba flamelloides]
MSRAASCRTITLEERSFLNELMESIGEEIKSMAWIRKRKTRDKKLIRIEDRLIVVSKYRIITVGKRKGSIKKKVCRSGHLFDLKKIIRHEIGHIELFFKNFQIDILSDQSDDLLTTIFQNYHPIIEGFPDKSLLKFEGDFQRFEEILEKPTNTLGKGFVDTYKAWCNYFKVEACEKMIDRIHNNILSNEDKSQQKILNLSFMSELPKEMREDKVIQPIAASLMHNLHFDEIYISALNWSKAVTIFSAAIGSSKMIKKITFSGLRITDGIKLLGIALTNPKLPLEYIDLSNNSVSDKEMKHLTNGLENMKSGLKHLNFSNNSLNSDSISRLLTALKNNVKHSKIQFLDLSNNKFHRSGSLQLELFLRAIKTKMRLTHLNLSKCYLDLGFICKSITEACKERTLQYLNLSNNKCEKNDYKSIAKMCLKMSNIKHLSLINCNLKGEQTADILEKIFKNNNLSDFVFRASSNPIGIEGAKKIQYLFKKYKNKNVLKELFLDDCQMENEGLSRICKTMNYVKGLERLSISRNFSHGTTDKYSSFISSLFEIENIKFLRLTGSKKRNLSLSASLLGEFFGPLMANTTLKGLDISGNMLGDEGCQILANCLSVNQGLHSLYFDRNDVTLKTIQKFIWSLKENKTIFDIKWPKDDIQHSYKNSKKKSKESLKIQIKDLKKKLAQSLESNKTQGGIKLDEVFGTTTLKSTKTKNKPKQRHSSMKVRQKVNSNIHLTVDKEKILKISKSEGSDGSSDSEQNTSEN